MLTVELCMGTSCHLMGVQDLVAVLETLPAEQREQIEIKGVTCFKNCGKGPNTASIKGLFSDWFCQRRGFSR